MASSDDAEGHIDENARSALVMHGGFGGVGNNKSTHGRMNIARVLQFGTSTTSWRWSELKVSGSPTTARMNHRLHVINATCIITFGGSGDGEHLSDVSVGTPNRRRRAESASMLVGDPGNGALDSDANTLDDSDALESDANAFDESEYQVIRTVRTADKSKRVRKQSVMLDSLKLDSVGAAHALGSCATAIVIHTQLPSCRAASNIHRFWRSE